MVMSSISKDKNIFLSAPFIGPINGHLSTANSIKKSFISLGFKLYKVEQPSRYNFSFIKYLKYIFNIFYFNSIKKNKVYYIFLHRTRLSFYLKDFPIFIIAMFSNSKIIVHLIGGDIIKFIHKLSFIEKQFVFFIFSKINTWVVLGKKMRRDILSLTKSKKQKKIIINPGLCEEDNFKKIKIKKKKEITISFMSHLIYEKGIVLFLETIIDLVENHNLKIRVKIAGKVPNGFQNKYVDSIIKEAKKKNYILFVGVLKGPLKWKFLYSSKIFVLPTFYQSESLPLVLLDAMRAGCYCISSSIGEIQSLLSENRGCIIQNLSKNRLKREIITIINNPNKLKNSSIKAQKFVIDNFNRQKHDEIVMRTLY